MNRQQVLGLVVGATLLGLLLAHPTAAITLIPPSFEYSVNPGETITTKVKLFNETTGVLTRHASVTNFRAKDETGVPDFLPEERKEGLATWIELGLGPYTIQPGERIEIPVEIKVPADAPPGGHYATIFFSSQNPEPGTEGSQVTIGEKIGSLVLLRVEGEVRESGTIASFSTVGGQTSFSRLPIKFGLRFQNAGNVHVRPSGTVTIRNMLGGTSVELPVNTALNAALPASIRKFDDIAWEKTTNAEERGNFFQEIAREWKNFAIGPYTATASLTYGQADDKSATAATKFFVMPWRALTLSILVIVVIIWLVVLLVKRYNQWVIRRASEKQTPKK